MREKESGIPEKLSGFPERSSGRNGSGAAMSSLLTPSGERLTYAQAIRRIGEAAPTPPRGNARLFEVVAGATGASWRQIKALFYGEVREPRGRLLLALHDALDTLETKAQSHAHSLIAETADLSADYGGVLEALARDPHFVRAVAAHLGSAAPASGADAGGPLACADADPLPAAAPVRTAGLPAFQRQG